MSIAANPQEFIAPQKSRAAFRTIAEVADDLGVETHVLRFWESKFPLLKPMKMRGGRRYYRPEDIANLREIKHLLYEKGFTIKGAKKFLGQKRGIVIIESTPEQKIIAQTVDQVFATANENEAQPALSAADLQAKITAAVAAGIAAQQQVWQAEKLELESRLRRLEHHLAASQEAFAQFKLAAADLARDLSELRDLSRQLKIS